MLLFRHVLDGSGHADFDQTMYRSGTFDLQYLLSPDSTYKQIYFMFADKASNVKGRAESGDARLVLCNEFGARWRVSDRKSR